MDGAVPLLNEHLRGMHKDGTAARINARPERLNGTCRGARSPVNTTCHHVNRPFPRLPATATAYRAPPAAGWRDRLRHRVLLGLGCDPFDVRAIRRSDQGAPNHWSDRDCGQPTAASLIRPPGAGAAGRRQPLLAGAALFCCRRATGAGALRGRHDKIAVRVTAHGRRRRCARAATLSCRPRPTAPASAR
jgi:hypothetical protein